jgi:hypothetical protein
MRSAASRYCSSARGPFKPGFGLSGHIQILSTLSSRPEEIIANAMICGVEGPAVSLRENALRPNQNGRHANANERREDSCPVVEPPHSNQHRT